MQYLWKVQCSLLSTVASYTFVYLQFIPGRLMLVQLSGHDSASLPEGFGASSNNNRLLRSVQSSAVEDEVTDSGSNDKQLTLVRSSMILLCSIM